jgi:hypothetical protein
MRQVDSRLRRYNFKKQEVEFRPPNPGKLITDNLPTVQIDPELLDLYSEIQPLPDGPGAFKDRRSVTG